MRELTIDGERLWDSLSRMGEIGATPAGGVNRQTLTDGDRAARDLLVIWCREAGCRVRVDPAGNIFGRRAGRHGSRPAVALGSHLDTQPTAGRFDGALGVLAALEVVRTLNDHGAVTELPLELVSWTNEEGCRFAPSMMGSGVFAGQFDPVRVAATADAEGRTFGAELERIGYRGGDPVAVSELGAYFELHIEQGPVLEQEPVAIGVVTGAQGQRWFDLVVSGREAHAGPTPMPDRRDALLGAARIVAAVNRIGHAHLPGACATVGSLAVHPNSRNTIPGRVAFSVDLRHPEEARFNGDEGRSGGRGGCDLRRGRPGVASGGDLAPVAAVLRSRLRRCRAARGVNPGTLLPRDRLRCRARRLPPRGARADGDDLHSVRGRHQPQRAGARHPRGLRRRLQRVAAGRAGARRRHAAGPLRKRWSCRIGGVGYSASVVSAIPLPRRNPAPSRPV